jgi:hypothetical protein
MIFNESIGWDIGCLDIERERSWCSLRLILIASIEMCIGWDIGCLDMERERIWCNLRLILIASLEMCNRLGYWMS